jgi:hypothetical protein
MTFTAPSVDFYDDGLVHGHDWSRNTPPGGHPADARHSGTAVSRHGHDHDDGLVHEHRWARQ